MNDKEHWELVGEFTRLLQRLGIEDEFRSGIHIDDLCEMNSLSSDVAWSVLENKLNELINVTNSNVGPADDLPF